MNIERRFQVILEDQGKRNVLSFYEFILDSISMWSCFPIPFTDMMDIPTEQKYGNGSTPEEAFKDLYFKLNPGIVEYNVEEFDGLVLHQHNAG